MATSELERMLDDWAIAWSSNNSSDDPERVLALFVDDCVFEDVTFGAVAHGKEELRTFVKGAFAAVPDCQAHTTATSQGCRPLAGAFRRCGARASSNWRPVKSAASLIIGMQLRS